MTASGDRAASGNDLNDLLNKDQASLSESFPNAEETIGDSEDLSEVAGKKIKTRKKRTKMSDEEAHIKKLARDRLWQKNVRVENSAQKLQTKSNRERLEIMIKSKKDKLIRREMEKQEIEADLMKCKADNEVVLKLLKEKEREEVFVKEKFKKIFKHQSVCKQ